jgi:hypothetical protein
MAIGPFITSLIVNVCTEMAASGHGDKDVKCESKNCCLKLFL